MGECSFSIRLHSCPTIFLNKFRGFLTMCSASGGEEDEKSFCRVTASVLHTTWILLPCVCNKHYESWFPRDPTPACSIGSLLCLGRQEGSLDCFPWYYLAASFYHPPTWFIVWSFRISFSHRRLVQSLEIFRQFYTTSLMSPLHSVTEYLWKHNCILLHLQKVWYKSD